MHTLYPSPLPGKVFNNAIENIFVSHKLRGIIEIPNLLSTKYFSSLLFVTSCAGTSPNKPVVGLIYLVTE